MPDAVRGKIHEMIELYARRGMRTLGLAYRDFPKETKLSEIDENDLTFVSLVGIEDPLRAEVPGAIEKCYRAGIDVRMVTGDSPNTAVSIAAQAGIVRKEHFLNDDLAMVAENLRPNVMMEGKEFRKQVCPTLHTFKYKYCQLSFFMLLMCGFSFYYQFYLGVPHPG